MYGAVLSKQGTNIPKWIIVFNGTVKKKYIDITWINTCLQKETALFVLAKYQIVI